jgi:hypothetical protein
MSVSITIDGVERSSVVDFTRLRRSNQINDKTDTLIFEILRGGSKTYTPKVGDEIIMTINSIREFGGVIVRVTDEMETPKLVRYKVECKDYAHVFDRQLVTQNYTNTTVQAIIEDIVDTKTTGFTYTQVNAPISVKSISFNRLTPSKCLEKLARKTNYHWFIDYYKDVNFNAKNSQTAPFNLTDDDTSDDYGKYIYMSLKQERDFSQIRNVILVEGGEEVGVTRTITRDGGEASSEGVLNLEYKFSEKPTVTVNGFAQTIGIDFLDDDNSFDAMWNFNEKYLRWTLGNEPTDGDVILITGTPLFPIIVNVPDNDSIGEFGVYEHTITDDTIRSSDEAIERAIAEISAYGDSIVEGSFKTYNSGLRAGQLINIKDTFRDIDEDVLIQSVSLRSITPNGDRLEHNVKYATLKTISIIDFLQEQILDDKITEGQLEQLLSLVRVQDSASTSDTLNAPTVITSPYKWSPSADGFSWGFGKWS